MNVIMVSRSGFASIFDRLENGRITLSSSDLTNQVNRQQGFKMSITTTGNLGPMILQSLAPAMLYVPTPTMRF